MSSGTYLGFDAGGKRLGIAAGEAITGNACALEVFDCREGIPDWSRLESLIREWRPTALVVGIPRHADGSASQSTRLAERFAGELARRTGCSVHRIDEHLSSHEARSDLRQRGRPAKMIDAEAARIILETWLSEQPP